MHKKLEAELVSLAHRILQMKNKDEVAALRDKARELYERLAVLVFVDEHILTSNIEISKEELLNKIEKANELIEAKKSKSNSEKSSFRKEEKPKIEEKPESHETMFEPKFDSVRIDIGSLKSNQISSKEEFRDAISADKTSTLFDDDETFKKEKKTLNDKLLNDTIKVGLNDRIAFVNHLFNFSQADFNRVLSQLNTFNTEKEAKDFILTKVKPEYNWQGKDAYEERLMLLIERKF
jgi:hypothetical protein